MTNIYIYIKGLLNTNYAIEIIGDKWLGKK